MNLNFNMIAWLNMLAANVRRLYEGGCFPVFLVANKYI
jgi:hypothetical protein